MARTGMTDGVEASEWAGAMGDKWLANIDGFEGMIAAVGAALMAKAAFAPGERVVDIGCGGGATTIEIGRAVGPDGEALGLDVSESLLDTARQRAGGIGNVHFLAADAGTLALDAPRDRLFSRFGVMFFNDFPAAFANMRNMLRPGGRADFSAWAPAREHGWIVVMQAIRAKHVTRPAAGAQCTRPLCAAGRRFRPAADGECRLPLGRIRFVARRAAGRRQRRRAGASRRFRASRHVVQGCARGAAGCGVLIRCAASWLAMFTANHRDGAVRMPAGAWLISARG